MLSPRALFGCFAAATTAGALVLACSGAAQTSLFDAPTGFSASQDASAGSPSSPLRDASAPIVTTPTTDAAAHDAAAPPDDAAQPPASDDSGSPGADSAPPADPGISCGTGKPCDPKTKVCCISTGNGGSPSFSCESASDCDSNGGLSLPCEKAADCRLSGSPPGTVCCVSEGSGSQSASSVACVLASQCTQSTQSCMCDPAAPDACPAGDTCTMSSVTIPPYSICVKAP